MKEPYAGRSSNQKVLRGHKTGGGEALTQPSKNLHDMIEFGTAKTRLDAIEAAVLEKYLQRVVDRGDSAVDDHATACPVVLVFDAFASADTRMD